MKRPPASLGGAARGLLPDRAAGPMPWLIAAMMFLTVLAGAAALALGDVARTLEGSDRLTVQVLAPNPDIRAAEARAALAAVKATAGVAEARLVPPEEIEGLLEPWLGAGAGEDIPVPAVVEARLSGASVERVRAAVARAAPSARVDTDAAWLAPLSQLVAALRWVAVALIGLAAAAAAGAVVLAARAALDAHRSTVEVLHLIGATDAQVARLFVRRMGRDAAAGSLLGFAAAGGVAWLIGRRLDALGAGIGQAAAMTPMDWLVLASLPLLGVLLAMLVARAAILRALNRFL